MLRRLADLADVPGLPATAATVQHERPYSEQAHNNNAALQFVFRNSKRPYNFLPTIKTPSGYQPCR